MEKHLHKLFYDLEKYHWWSLGIRKIQLHFVRKFTPVIRPDILDIGSGPGATLAELSKIGNAIGIDSSRYALYLARRRGLTNVRYGNVTKLQYASNKFDCVTLFDVIEHVKDEKKVLSEVYRILNPGGIAVITSPAYMWLYDDHDRMNHHFKRYTASEFNNISIKAGFTVKYLGYCNSFLFPGIILVKLINKLFKRHGLFNNQETKEPLNGILKIIFSSEVYFLNAVRFPFGLSILVVLEKPESEGKR